MISSVLLSPVTVIVRIPPNQPLGVHIQPLQSNPSIIKITSIPSTSLLYNTPVKEGMIILKVNGEEYNDFDHGCTLIKRCCGEECQLEAAFLREDEFHATMQNDANGNENNNTSIPTLPTLFQPNIAHKFCEGYDAFMNSLIGAMSPYGILRTIFDTSHSNRNESTEKSFPYRRGVLICGSCSRKDREAKGSEERGCCGFKLRFLLCDKDVDEPHLLVKEFCLPPNSKHRLHTPSPDSRILLPQRQVIKHKDMLTPKKINIMKSMGKCRAQTSLVQRIIEDQYDGRVYVEPSLMYRVMKEGREEAWGKNDTESMVLFYGDGMKLLNNDDRFGVAGKFKVNVCPSSSKIVQWLMQTPLEVLNARIYGKDAVWVDTTHNTTTYMLKTGPLSVVDWGGHTAPAGLYQVQQEEIDACRDMQAGLDLDYPDATCGTDGGSAWPELVRQLHLRHMEDTFHNEQNANKHASTMQDNKLKKQFLQMKDKALYNVMSPAELIRIFCDMRQIANDNQAVLNWIDRIEEGKEIRTATYTTKNFCCSSKGATSRCEVSMSRLKRSGFAKAEMRSWTLAELFHRQMNIVQQYEHDAKVEMKEAIKNKTTLSEYVLKQEEDERNHINELRIVSYETNKKNPFHGIQQSSKDKITIRVYNKSGVPSTVGLSIKYEVYEGVHTLLVGAIDVTSMFAQTSLRIGMRIFEVNGNSFQADGNLDQELFTFKNGRLNISAFVPPSTGTVYIVGPKLADKSHAKHTVYVPDDETMHCQSDFHVHTVFWIRDRYIQRALIDHPSRSMRQTSTIHFRWHITNSPLYPIVYNELIELMEVDGLKMSALPSFLANAPNPETIGLLSADENEDVDKQEHRRKGFSVPNCKKKRYNDGNSITSSINDMISRDKRLYEMVMPQYKQIYQNCVAWMETSSIKAKSAQSTLTAKKVNLPIVPEKLRKTDKSEDINNANIKSNKKRQRKRKKVNEDIREGNKTTSKDTSSGTGSTMNDSYYDSSEDDTPLLALKEGEGDFGLPMHNKGVSVNGKEGCTAGEE